MVLNMDDSQTDRPLSMYLVLDRDEVVDLIEADCAACAFLKKQDRYPNGTLVLSIPDSFFDGVTICAKVLHGLSLGERTCLRFPDDTPEQITERVEQALDKADKYWC